MDCSFDECKNPSLFYCLCTGNQLNFCQSHSVLHCSNKGSHKLHNLYIKLDEPTFIKFCSKLAENYKIISEIIDLINAKTANFLNLIQELRQKSIAELKKKQANLLSQISSAKFREISINTYHQYLEQEYYDFSVSFDYIGKLTQEIEEFYNQDFTVYAKLNPLTVPSELYKGFVFFEKNSKTMKIYDLLKSQLASYEVQNNEYFGDYAGWCQLPSRKIFHFGGQLNTFYPPLSATYVIDPDSQTVEKKADGIWCKYTVGSCSYLDHSIYVFGGAGYLGAVLGSCEKYDLVKDSWTSISEMPCASDYNCSAVKGNEIFVTGYRIGVFRYSVELDTFSSCLEIEQGGKALFIGGEEIVLVDHDCVLVCDSDWEKVCSKGFGSTELTMISYPVRKGTNVYFLMSDFSVYRYQAVARSLEKVKVIEDS